MNVKDWARKIQTRLPAPQSEAFEGFLIGNSTFAEAATALIEVLVENGDEVHLEAVEAKIDRIKDRIAAGEDAEAVVKEETA